MKEKTRANRKYKDRLFNFIFGREENREWTLSLYNAINDSHYTDASKIEFNTLENVLYIGMKNDTSFLLSDVLSVYEHQSTFNPNMPLRMLEYVGDLFAGYVEDNKLNMFGEALLELPTPKLVVFYNGTKEEEDEQILKLSDSFTKSLGIEADVEVRVLMLNVNYGRNKKIMRVCKPLEEYSWFVEKVREAQKTTGDIKKAVNEAIKAMPKDFVIRDFLVKHKAEVNRMLDTEYDEEKVMALFKEDGKREERVNTEREKKRADAEKERADVAEERADAAEERADAAEEEVRKLKELLAKNNITVE